MKPTTPPKTTKAPTTGSSPIFKRLEKLHQELKTQYGLVDDIYLHPDTYAELIAAEKLTIPVDGDQRGRLTVVTYTGPVDIKAHPFGAKLEET